MLKIEQDIREFSLDRLPMGIKASGYLKVMDGPIGEVRVPVLVAVGATKGPVLFATAGVHGNEYEGQEAVRRFFDGLSPLRMKGSFISIPVCNVFAHEAGERESPAYIDAANLARIFPGNPTGTPTYRLAHALFELVTRTVGSEDLFIDLHSAEKTYNLLPLAGYRTFDNPARARSEAAAKCLNGFRLWELKPQTGRFNAEVAVRGIPSVGTEITGAAGCEEADVSLYVEALRSLSGFLGIAPYPFEGDRDSKPLTMLTVTAPESGFLRRLRKRGDVVTEGELLGSIVSATGEVRAKVVSPSTGIVCGDRRTPMIWAGDTCFWIGVEV